MTDSDKMRATLDLAETAMAKGIMPIASIVYLDDEVIAQAYTTRHDSNMFLRHSEIVAMWDADGQGHAPSSRVKMQLFTNLEPCVMCMSAAVCFFIGEVYYALEAPLDGGAYLLSGIEKKFMGFPKPKIIGGLMREESLRLFEEYTRTTDEEPFRQWTLKMLDALDSYA